MTALASISSILDHESARFVVLGLSAFVAGVLFAAAHYREKRMRENGTRYFHCKDCGREHALSFDGSWHALRTSEEVEDQRRRCEQAEREREAMKKG